MYALLKAQNENKLCTTHFKERQQLKSLVNINNVYSLALDPLSTSDAKLSTLGNGFVSKNEFETSRD